MTGNQMKEEEADLARLADSRERAPDDLADRIMSRLPDAPDRSWSMRMEALWPSGGTWALPAAAGAAAALLVVLAVSWRLGAMRPDTARVSFEFHAPGAGRVELVGSFNNWEVGAIVLEGPSKTGHWKASVDLPQGRHEYMFLVDGRHWVTDPDAAVHRNDGFGRQNAVVEI